MSMLCVRAATVFSQAGGLLAWSRGQLLMELAGANETHSRETPVKKNRQSSGSLTTATSPFASGRPFDSTVATGGALL